MAFLTYPAQGATVKVVITVGGIPNSQQTIDIPAGSAPFVVNLTCTVCYRSKSLPIFTASYLYDSSSSVSLSPTGPSIPEVVVTDAGSVSEAASVQASFSGLVVNGEYSVALWCDSPAMVVQATLKATAVDQTSTFSFLPGICGSSRYLVLSSSDQVYMVASVASAGR